MASATHGEHLYIALLRDQGMAGRPVRFEQLFEIQSRTAREREWDTSFPDDAASAAEAFASSSSGTFVAAGARTMTHMAGRDPLEATLMRRGARPLEGGAEFNTGSWMGCSLPAHQPEQTGAGALEVVRGNSGDSCRS